MSELAQDHTSEEPWCHLVEYSEDGQWATIGFPGKDHLVTVPTEQNPIAQLAMRHIEQPVEQ